MALAIIIFSVLINLPFANQAFHIDDPVNIYLARHIIHHPENPYGFLMIYNGAIHSFDRFFANPPLNGYLLSFMIRLVGEHEIGLHLFFLIYTIFSGWLMFLISKKFLNGDDQSAFFSAVLLLFSPAFFVMNHTIMMDTPLLCFYLASIYFFLEAETRPSFYLLAGMFAALASLTRYTGMTLIPLFLCMAVLNPKQRSLMSFWSIIIPMFVFECWYFWTCCLYSSGYWLNIVSYETAQDRCIRIVAHFLANIDYLAMASIFPLSWFLLARDKKDQNLFPTRQFQMRFLFFWVALLVVVNSLFLQTGVKYNLLELPAVILIFVLSLKRLFGQRTVRLLMITAVLTGFLSMVVAVADNQLANLYRDYAAKLYFGYKRENNQVYYSGHWGWGYYLQKLGAKSILSIRETRTHRGDIILFPSLPWPQPIFGLRLKLLKTVTIRNNFPVRTMNGEAGAFFYSNYNFPYYIGFFPYALSMLPLEKFYVLEVQ